MALAATGVIEIQTGGSDTANGGGFDIAATGKPTDLTTDANTGNTSAPVVSSASYNFVAGDVGSWVFIQTSGGASGWISGWYKISSVASNKATLNAAIGAAVLYNGVLNTAVGVSTAATPTGGTWAVDYCQITTSTSATGMTTVGISTLISWTGATKAMVGNYIIITGGTNFTTGTYQINAAVAGVSITVDRNATTGVGTSGTGGVGGCLASPGKAASIGVGGMQFWSKAATFSFTSASTNIAGGCVSSALPGPTSGSTNTKTRWLGYSSIRGDNPAYGSRPVFQLASGVTSATIFTIAANYQSVRYIRFDGNSQTSANGFALDSNARNHLDIQYCDFLNCPGTGCNPSGLAMTASNLYATGCGTGFNFTTVGTIGFVLVSISNTIGFDFGAGTITWAIAGSNSSHGFKFDNNDTQLINFISYNNSGDGVNATSSGPARNMFLANGIVYGNTTGAINIETGRDAADIYNCATSGTNTFGNNRTFNLVTLTADPFVAGGTNFSLNNTAGGGAACRAAAIPGAFPGLASTTGYLDIGAVQSQNVAQDAGGGIVVLNREADWSMTVVG